jgi:nicotinamide-nucleotide amidase
MLAVPELLIAERGVVSAEVAEAMATACRIRFGTDLAASTVGLAGPTGAAPEKPIGLVFVALADATESWSQRFNWTGTREQIQTWTSKLCLNQVRLHLLKQQALSFK